RKAGRSSSPRSSSPRLAVLDPADERLLLHVRLPKVQRGVVDVGDHHAGAVGVQVPDLDLALEERLRVELAPELEYLLDDKRPRAHQREAAFARVNDHARKPGLAGAQCTAAAYRDARLGAHFAPHGSS